MQKGQPAAFFAEASSSEAGASLIYSWNFGDGTSTSGINLSTPAHTYTTLPLAGEFTVSLTVSDGVDSTTVSVGVNVLDMPPSVWPCPGQTVFVGDAVPLNAVIDDPNGSGEVATVEWDFDYDGVQFSASGSGLSTSHTYDRAGQYVVAVRVTDVGGNSTLAVTSVRVKAIGSILVCAGADVEVAVGQSHTFDGSYLAPQLSVATSGIAWDFDYDGRTFYPDSTGTLAPSHSFDWAGTFHVALRVTATNGVDSDISVLSVEARNTYAGPTANAGSDQTINQGSSVTFVGSYSDPDGLVDLYSGIQWDFDYSEAVGFHTDTSGTLTPMHQYTRSGSYLVALRVTDEHGLSDLHVIQVTVNNLAPSANAGSDQTVTIGQEAFFSGWASDAGGWSEPITVEWDFAYDGVEFFPGAVNTTYTYRSFDTAGIRTVAFRATDSDGASTIATLQVLVTGSIGLVEVHSGTDEIINQGDTITFDGSFLPASGVTVDTGDIDWDFDYQGWSFAADPAANGTLTPTHLFAMPGLVRVALRIRASDGLTNETRVSSFHVRVENVAPAVDAGDDLEINEGGTVTFAATASDAGGAPTVEWDFDYDGLQFNSDWSAYGSLDPTHTYTSARIYTAAIRATDSNGLSVIDTVYIHVNSVAPTATVSDPGTAGEATSAVFTLSDLSDVDSGTSFSFWADWTDSGEFEELLEGISYTRRWDGSVDVYHTYDDDTDGTALDVTIRLMDAAGSYTDYARSLIVTNRPPSAAFDRPYSYVPLGPGAPVVLVNVTDFSFADEAAGFSYFFSVDGGPFAQSSNPWFVPGGYGSGPDHWVNAYVVDKDGGVSPVYTSAVSPEQTTQELRNYGTGWLAVTWDGGSATLAPDTVHDFGGVVSGLTLTLLTSGATYNLSTNGSIQAVQAAVGVSSVLVNLSTSTARPPVGTGDVGDVSVPGGGSTLSIEARGDLGNVVGPGGVGDLGCKASGLSFTNLTGSIIGLDWIGTLGARGWLGDDAEDRIWIERGIATFGAYGIKGDLVAARHYSTEGLTFSGVVGRGGVPGSLDAAAVSLLRLDGDARRVAVGTLTGDLIVTRERIIDQLFVDGVQGDGRVTAEIGGRVGSLILGSRLATSTAIRVLGDTLRYVPCQAEVVKRTPFTTAYYRYWRNWDISGALTGGPDQHLTYSEMHEAMIRSHKEVVGEEAAALVTLRIYIDGLTGAFGAAWWVEYERAAADPSHKLHRVTLQTEQYYRYALERIKTTPRTQVFVGDPDPAAVSQGQAGDCAALASIISLIEAGKRFPAEEKIPRVARMIQGVQIAGKLRYKVTFPGDDLSVTVDPPTSSEIAYFASAGNNGLWLTILEKAYAIHRNRGSRINYLNQPYKFMAFRDYRLVQQSINGEWMHHAVELFSANASVTLTTEKQLIVSRLSAFFAGRKNVILGQKIETMLPTIKAALDSGSVITAQTVVEHMVGGQLLPGAHAYAIVGYVPDDVGRVAKIKLRNPHNVGGRFGSAFHVDVGDFVKWFPIVTVQRLAP